ncbi:catechol 2,3-dioxygenase-like lactoylglutathione lyase family enzyme [Variovorax boronicumulans]|uniref:Catechol 2,3-dioxygenase-like lactoylglutathione lyase family enzyme n=1 Tax=Variovorax boronicumulans TaxID=436515 RepID=A0AAW8DTC1_9BURK|nr:VOC family protein [Variovorax boronicumulans]MDP9877401.1 catechol 2,3-dioxygenase-like lactoylglutathione lyase family enzyme [Variovorax boronicumulans]MDP9922686.1 catechol 2,3-dioxygenase-like lactoylglutathione lyase family enzyme [Variovorax boronicumulans]
MQPNSPLQLQFSHIGLYVTDLDRMAGFYKRALRFTQTDAGDLGPVQLVFLSRDPNEHHQLVLATGRPADMAFNVVNQLSFRVPDLATLRAFHGRLLDEGATDMQPVTHGNAVSVYCRDPEGNRLELFMDTPWYCDQPLREPIDLAQSDEAILARAETIAKRFPKFMSRAQWQAEVARRMQEDQHV